MNRSSIRNARLFAGLALLVASLAPAVAGAQNVTYSGKLQIGYNDQDNVSGFPRSSVVPTCAGAGPLLNPGTIGTTLGTLRMNARGTAAPGVGGSMIFHAVSGEMGGAQEKSASTCRSAIPPYANVQLRSRTFYGSAHFPGRKGPFTPMILSASAPVTPTATYMLSAGGGNTQGASVFSWTTMATFSAPAVSYTGSAVQATPPFWLGSGGLDRIQPGGQRFGGGLPYSGVTGLRIGIGFPFGDFTPPPTDYGQQAYANGVYSVPLFIGTAATGAHIESPVTTTVVPTSLAFPLGLLFGRHDLTHAARTPGGTTIDQHGAILTAGGGNTVTPHPTFCPGPGCGLAVISPVAYSVANFEWTTGALTHTDQVGDFYTIRRAQGFDVAVAPSTAVAGETRRLQVVSPWSASIRQLGIFGLSIPRIGRGGVAILNINVIPAPEPGFAMMLVAGAFGIGFRARIRHRA